VIQFLYSTATSPHTILTSSRHHIYTSFPTFTSILVLHSYLTGLGLYDEDVMQITSYGFAPACHLFERSVTMDIDIGPAADDEGGLGGLPADHPPHRLPPLQSVFALKEAHGGKLDSHFWFFSAFCPQLNPR
jgi:chitin synthase